MELPKSLKHNWGSTNIIPGSGRIGEGDTFYTEWEETYESFDQMGLHENLLRGIYAYGEFLAAVTQQQPLLYRCSNVIVKPALRIFVLYDVDLHLICQPLDCLVKANSYCRSVSVHQALATRCSTGWLHSLTGFDTHAGFEKPSAIQQKGIVPFGKGLDVIQQAQSGTGKTATFCAGILQNLDYNLMECQALVLAPTRELAQQIEKVMRALGDYQQVSC